MLLKKSKLLSGKTIVITGSKSITNRLLVLQKLFGGFSLQNASNSQDSQLLQVGLASDNELIDIHHAGTAMRFLTAYLAIQEGKTTILTGSERMKQRPIKPLVEALRDLGSAIEYLENEGFPPLKIIGKKLIKNKVRIPAYISSQFITALMMIGGKLEKGLTIELEGEITSRPYLEMTLELINSIFQMDARFHPTENGNEIITIPSINDQSSSITYNVESDWSSASYFYSLVAIGREDICLKSFNESSLQGDSVLVKIYENYFGVRTEFHPENLILLKPIPHFHKTKSIILDMNHCPDIAQTVCVTATALKIPFEITGLGTLKVKETDRLLALKYELQKIGCEVEITENSIKSLDFVAPELEILIKTYNDHRMAMSFAPFALVQNIIIENPEVVEKSYPEFWEDFSAVTEILN